MEDVCTATSRIVWVVRGPVSSVDEVLCADRRTEEQNKEDKDKGARAKRKKYVRDAAIGGTFGGTFGGILGISTAIVAVVAAVGGRRSRRRTQRGHGHGERGIYRGRESGTLEMQ